MFGKLSWPKNSGGIFTLVVASFLLVFLGASCHKSEPKQKSDWFEKSVKSDGVKVIVRSSDRSIRTSDLLLFELTVESDPRYQVKLPEVPEKLGSFFVVDSHTEVPRLNDSGQVVIDRSYLLEPDVPGQVDIPELQVTVEPKPPFKGKTFSLKSPALSVQVLSVLAGKKETFRDIAPDVRKPEVESTSHWQAALLMSTVVVALCLLLVWRKWKKSGDIQAVNPQRDWENLATCSANEKRKRMESALSAYLATRFSLDLKAFDFQGVQEQLKAQKVELPGFDENLARFNRFQYGVGEVSDDDVDALYQMWDEWMRHLPDLSEKERNRGKEILS